MVGNPQPREASKAGNNQSSSHCLGVGTIEEEKIEV